MKKKLMLLLTTLIVLPLLGLSQPSENKFTLSESGKVTLYDIDIQDIRNFNLKYSDYKHSYVTLTEYVEQISALKETNVLQDQIIKTLQESLQTKENEYEAYKAKSNKELELVKAIHEKELKVVRMKNLKNGALLGSIGMLLLWVLIK